MSNQSHEECEGVDDGGQSSGVLEADVISGDLSVLTQRPNGFQESNSKLKKAAWLRDHFRDIKRGSKCIYICNACNKEYRNRRVQRLIEHFDKCSGTDKSKKPVISGESCSNSEMNDLWAKVCVENNISFKAVESRSFKIFATKLNN